jgi:hypothetical protein
LRIVRPIAYSLIQTCSAKSASVYPGAETANASVAVGMNYYKKESIANRDREYSAIPPFLSSNSSPLNLEVGRLAAIAAGVPVTGLPSANTFFAQSGATSSNNGQRPASAYTYTGGRSSAFNFNEFSMSFPESKRLGAFASAERKLFGTDNVKGYVDLSYQNVRTENQLAPSATGNFTGAGQVELVIPARTSTPILTVIEGGVPRQVAAGTAVPSGAIPGSGTKFINGLVQRAAVAGAFNPLNPFNQDITGGTRARFAEFGNRIYRNETDAFSIATGVKADRILGKWNVDVGYSYSQIKDTSRNSLDSISRFNRLVNAADSLFSPGSSDYSGQTTPYNPFGYYQVPIATNQTITGLAKVDTKDMNKSDLGQLTFTAATGSSLNSMPAESASRSAATSGRKSSRSIPTLLVPQAISSVHRRMPSPAASARSRGCLPKQRSRSSRIRGAPTICPSILRFATNVSSLRIAT